MRRKRSGMTVGAQLPHRRTNHPCILGKGNNSQRYPYSKPDAEIRIKANEHSHKGTKPISPKTKSDAAPPGDLG